MTRDVSLWFFTDRVRRLYELLNERQLRAAQTALAGGSGDEPDVRFQECSGSLCGFNRHEPWLRSDGR